MKHLTACILLTAGLFGGAAIAADTAPAAAPAKKAAKKPVHKKEAHVHEEKAPEMAGMQAVDYHCELGNKVTLYHAPDDDQKISIHWKKQMHELTRVGTSTGANRFENPKDGLVWIGIPAKGMLLDSKKGQQLANECKNAEQSAPKVSESKGEGNTPK
ncbi:hypothetical protein [Noviherbaspirillum galbum]|uniref:Uncharacterized protein n=1 Tax=Noviherbaspirillum galbum TaxID=2709383 RepID=A0A6B3SP26_9BURK|nr:hypothetical protein [Noviherbaspirillum galbum]NEX62493.1 hypothetical protein [Noviherbaspirillum galbum]